MRTALRVSLTLLAALAAAVTLFWFWLAVGVHLSGAARYAAEGTILFFALAAVLLTFRLRWQRLALMSVAGVVLAQVWWAFVPVPASASWVPELSRSAGATLNADGTVTVRNIRDFAWTSTTEGTPAWVERTVDPQAVASVDVFSSVWGNPLIAHTMISFGFEDGSHIVFSSEIRRREGQVYSTLGGFVREFPLVMIAAEERDIIYLRTDLRRETVSLYPLTLDPEVRTRMFLAFVGYANELDADPQWYNTITGNCTTVPFRIVRGAGGTLPVDWRLVASGRLYELLHERGSLAPGLTPDQIAERARLPVYGAPPPDAVTYSRDIRKAWDGESAGADGPTG